jgi:hypothetical protein
MPPFFCSTTDDGHPAPQRLPDEAATIGAREAWSATATVDEIAACYGARREGRL